MGHRPPGYHSAKALRAIGLGPDAIRDHLKRELDLTPAEIDQVLSWPVTPGDELNVVEVHEQVATV